MHKNILLSVGITILFLCVGFQPALANEVSITKTSEVEEDCDECQPVNRVDNVRVRLLFIRLETITNIILSKFGHIPEVAEKCEEILNIIDSNRQWDYPLICAVLYGIFLPLLSITLMINVLYEMLHEKFPIFGVIIIFLEFPILAVMMVLTGIMIAYECSPFP